MIKQLLLILIVMGNSLSMAYSQAVPVDHLSRKLLSGTPQEKVFVHYNTSLLFSGEYFYYKVYVLNRENGLLSTISKIAYVELVGEDGEQVFKHKLKLENGLSQSDYFLPTSLPSGNYKLLAYTQWMKNGGKENFFQADIALINPYMGDQSAISSAEEQVSGIRSDSINFIGMTSSELLAMNTSAQDGIVLTTDKQDYGKRERVSLKIKLEEALKPWGRYSLSVKKVSPIPHPERLRTTSYSEMYMLLAEPGELHRVHLPELRGNLITGRIEPRNAEKNLSLGNRKVALSIPGEDFSLKISTTDEKGVFYFNLMKPYPELEAMLQLLGDDKEAFSIKLHPQPGVDYDALEFADFRISREMKELILERSVYNQIESAYYTVKPDTLLPSREVEPFYADTPEIYDLDAYTRFKTIKETFIEIIKYSRVGTNNKGEPVIEVTGLPGALDYGRSALLLVDGAMVQDHSLFINYPSTKVKSIGILRNNYYPGSYVFEGIVVVETIDGDFQESLTSDYIKPIELVQPQPEKRYFRQSYSDSSSVATERIPDFRSQLLWEPSLKIKADQVIPFYTSDNTGVYEISLEGFTGRGEPVSVRRYFKVE